MRRLALLAVVLPVLAGCSDGDWNNAMSYVGMGAPSTADRSAGDIAVAQPPAQAQQASAAPGGASVPNAFCVGVAKQDATVTGFDPATQQKVATRSYQQCVAVFGNAQ